MALFGNAHTVDPAAHNATTHVFWGRASRCTPRTC